MMWFDKTNHQQLAFVWLPSLNRLHGLVGDPGCRVVLFRQIGDERAARLREIAELREKQGELHMAFVAWCRAFREDSGADEAVDGLERTVEAAESWDELASMYQDELSRVAVERSTRFALRAGEIWREKVGDDQAAVTCLEHVLLADPARFPEERLAACRVMAEVHEAAGDWEGTAGALTRALEGRQEF